MAIKKSNTEAVNDYPPIRFKIRTEISDCRSLLFDPPCRNPVKSVPRGKAIWNANGGFVSVLLTHLFAFFACCVQFFCTHTVINNLSLVFWYVFAKDDCIFLMRTSLVG